MPDNYQQQFDKDRAQQSQEPEEEKTGPPSMPAPGEPISFPWGMLCLAILFDLIGMIPIVNFITETLACLIFGMWQKSYAPKLDPILTIIIAKIIDTAFLGFLPSNIGIVVYAYLKKKAVNVKEKLTPLANSRLGELAIKNIDSRYLS